MGRVYLWRELLGVYTAQKTEIVKNFEGISLYPVSAIIYTIWFVERQTNQYIPNGHITTHVDKVTYLSLTIVL